MKVTYEKGELRVDLHDLLISVDPQTKIEMVESLACDDDIITHVTNQILDGWTESGYHGGVLCTASANPQRGLDLAWRKIALKSGEIAQKEINRLEKALAESNKKNQELHEQLYRRRMEY